MQTLQELEKQNKTGIKLYNVFPGFNADKAGQSRHCLPNEKLYGPSCGLSQTFWGNTHTHTHANTFSLCTSVIVPV